MINLRRSITAIAGAALVGLGTLAARAADQEDDRWHFITAPHLWAAGINGNATVHGMKADVDVGFDDVVKNLDGGFMSYLELRKRKFGFYGNPMYLKLSADGGSHGRSFDFEQQLWIVEGGAFYNLGSWGQDKPLNLDVTGGLRYWNNHVDLKFKGPIIGTVKSSDTSELYDPVIGLRANKHFTERWSWSLRGDIGGFEISSSTSDFTWQAMGLIGYDFSKKYSLWAGYRALALRKEDGSGDNKHGVDIVMHGAIVGLQIKF